MRLKIIIIFIILLCLILAINFWVFGNLFTNNTVEEFHLFSPAPKKTCLFIPNNDINCLKVCLDQYGCNTLDCLERCKNSIMNIGKESSELIDTSDKPPTNKLRPYIKEVEVIRNGKIKIKVSHLSSRVQDDNGNPMTIPINIRSYIYTIRPEKDEGDTNNVHIGTYNLTRSDINQIFLYNYSIKCSHDYNLHDINLKLNQYIRNYNNNDEILLNIYNTSNQNSNEAVLLADDGFNKWKQKLQDYANKYPTTANTCVELKDMAIPIIDIIVDQPLNPDIRYTITVRSYEPEQQICDKSLLSSEIPLPNQEGRVNTIINNIAKQYDQVFSDFNINKNKMSTNQTWVLEMFQYFFINLNTSDKEIRQLWKSENHRDFVCRILMDNHNLKYVSNITHDDFMFGDSKLNYVNINIPLELQFECGTMFKPCIPIAKNTIQEPHRSDTISKTAEPNNYEEMRQAIQKLIEGEQSVIKRIKDTEASLSNIRQQILEETDPTIIDGLYTAEKTYIATIEKESLKKKKLQEYNKSYESTFSIPDHLSKKSNTYIIQAHLHKQNIPHMVSDTIQGMFMNTYSGVVVD